MAAGLRRLASKLSADDIKRLSKAQKLEASRERLEKQEKVQTKKAAAAAKRRARIERKLDALFGKKVAKAKKAKKLKAKRKYSPEALKRMAAGARRRWAKHNAAKGLKATSQKPGRRRGHRRQATPAPELVPA